MRAQNEDFILLVKARARHNGRIVLLVSFVSGAAHRVEPAPMPRNPRTVPTPLLVHFCQTLAGNPFGEETEYCAPAASEEGHD